MSPIDLAWVAGLLEGEGSFVRRNSGTDRNIRVQCHMTDLDVLQTLMAKIGKGSINGPYQNSKPEHKLRYMYQLCGYDAYLLMQSIYPLMGNRRRQRIQELLTQYDNVPVKTYRIQNIDTGIVEETTDIIGWMCSKDMKPSCNSNLWETISGKRNHYKRWKRLS